MLNVPNLSDASLLVLRRIEHYLTRWKEFPTPFALTNEEAPNRAWKQRQKILREYHALESARAIARTTQEWSTGSVTALGAELLLRPPQCGPKDPIFRDEKRTARRRHRLRGKLAEVLRFIGRFVGEHGHFPSPVTITEYLSHKVTSWGRSHTIAYLRRLEDEGVVARKKKHKHAAWEKEGYITPNGQILYETLPLEHKPKRERPKRKGGGIAADGGTKFKNMLLSAERLGSEMIQFADRYSKLGARVKKGNARQLGLRMATFSLEEGRTCSPDCGLRKMCYAGKMSLQKRILYEGTKTATLLAEEMRRAGPLHYRVNTVGDIPDSEFLLILFAGIGTSLSTAFGYTHWQPEDPLGAQIREFSDRYWDFFAIRTSYEHGSRKPLPERAAVVMPEFSKKLLELHNAVPCPQQLGQSLSCAACGYCWNTRRNVAFRHH